MPATRPIVREPVGTREIEQLRVAAVVRNAVRRGKGLPAQSNPFGQRMAGNKIASPGRVRGGTFTGVLK